MHQPGPFAPPENAAGAGVRAWVVRISTWVELRWVLFGQTGARALSGLAVLESGLGAPRASTLPLDPPASNHFFLRVGAVRDGIVSSLIPGRAAGWELMRKSPKQVTNLQ